MKFVYCAIVLCAFLREWTEGAKILAVFHMPSPSHQILGGALMKSLAAKGHEVTMATPYRSKENIPNYKNIFLEGLEEISGEFRTKLATVHNASIIEMISKIGGFTEKITETALNCTEMQTLLKSNEKFDLIILEAMFNEAHFGLAYRFNAPFIVVGTSGSMSTNHLTGNPAPYSFVPSMLTSSTDKMTFMERFTNTLAGVSFHFAFKYFKLPQQEVIYKKYFPDAPELTDTIKNLSLALINSHVCLETPRPYLPNMIPIGGFHVAEPKKLPEDLQLFLDSAKDGAVYFSLGSNLRSSDLPEERIKVIMTTFAKLKQKVLWKFENESLPGKPDNMKIGKWFPQSDLLAHPNMKLFITHGGLLSSTEAVYRGVPVLGIPFYGDQKLNTANFVAAGYGQQIQFADITEESFTDILTEMLTNPKYYQNVKKRSEIIQDQPMKPLDTAVFWVEHVLRHKGAKHLRSTVVDLTLGEYLLLDVVTFVGVIVGTFVVGIYLVIKTLCLSKVQRNSDTQKRKTKRE